MSAATSQAPLRSHSTRRHGYTPSGDKSNAPPSPRAGGSEGPRRSMSLPQGAVPASHSRNASGAGGNLSHVAQRDTEQTNLARPSTAHRSDSRDRPSRDGGVSRSESRRGPPSSSRQSHSRQQSEAASVMNGNEQGSSSRQGGGDSSHGPRRRTTVDAKSGVWELGKTIGAGSMGKVKLARHRETHEQVAVKIIPRQSTDDHKTAAEKERADHSKEVRTSREAAIVTLVDHPYICGMKDYVKTKYHWYMLFEYVNGGQMLDYIISHGRLKEKQARKFGRQIASALDYCHRNNIVHRDLKIENILISKTGDIKIIDFGLSNTFTPKGHLKTFCGSLYFAAPELLQAKQYTGPEVDVWSFGIVLYVLVCGKVPFDDQSMPQLHAKIKKGHVEYPPWLTNECRSLIARMLQTDPNQRATMSEIMCHPWMTKGFGGPPDNFLPPRRPLTLPLEKEVIRKMDGFDFGSASQVHEQLCRIIDSEEYQRAIQNWQKKINMPTPEVERKRGVFDFYKRRNSLSRDTLNSSSSEAVQWGQDPVNAFHPLVSVYFLAKEKIDRERGIPPGSSPAEEKPLPEKPISQPPSQQVTPTLAAPEAAYTNPATYEMAGESPTGGRSRPRARTHGQDEVAEDLRHVKIEDPPPPQVVTPPEAPPPRKESTAGSIFRKLSTRRHGRDHDRTPSLSVNSPEEGSSIPKKSFSIRRRDRSANRLTPGDAASPQGDLLSPPEEAAKRRGLGRSTSVNSAEFRRKLAKRQASEGASLWPTKTPPNKRKVSTDNSRSANDATTSDLEAPQSAPPASRTKSLGHARKESIQRRRQQRQASRAADVPEETDADMAANEDDEGDFTANEGSGSPNMSKPVFLKGLFSVSTTSSKPFKVIEADIIRVLRQRGVQYVSNGKGGFKCKYSPGLNIDTGRPADDKPPQIETPQAIGQHRRKLSFSLFGDDKDKEPRTPRNNRRPTDVSDEDMVESEIEDGTTPAAERRIQFSSPTMTPGERRDRPAGETSTHVQNDMGTNMDLRFEIFIVKVPLLSLHGIQFKKVDGGTWQYKSMAQRILDELRL
ncbi:protein kinase-like protein 6 [Elsinoe australis]|uniref:non-specific serine/threonine protein kinase n=1 Tax=Elsinoe australis TaxID=40998 RepID=A0A4U7AVW8_9PEZI|nr:protein kinase-like protein 6 [Elsinoe australis]